MTRLAVGKISYAGFYKQTYKLVTLTLCIVTSEITETVGGVAKTGLLILAEIRSGELITQMAVTSRLHKPVNNAQMIYEYTLAYKTCVF